MGQFRFCNQRLDVLRPVVYDMPGSQRCQNDCRQISPKLCRVWYMPEYAQCSALSTSTILSRLEWKAA